MGSTTNCSGSWNVLSPEAHKARGSFRSDRHAHRMPATPPRILLAEDPVRVETARHADIEMNDAPAAANYESFTGR